ncbi:hypothetical protein ACF1BS_03450 [Streptomyces sp. NPDC014748]|uniref:hypothetical protein n=1 Tax=Streptomyces sp. NPDC014748 TaxID=3364905 RepID=UPI003700C972
MPKRIKYTAWAVNKAGQHEYVEGETKFDEAYQSRNDACGIARWDLRQRGYREPHVDNTTIVDS